MLELQEQSNLVYLMFYQRLFFMHIKYDIRDCCVILFCSSSSSSGNHACLRPLFNFICAAFQYGCRMCKYQAGCEVSFSD